MHINAFPITGCVGKGTEDRPRKYSHYTYWLPHQGSDAGQHIYKISGIFNFDLPL